MRKQKVEKKTIKPIQLEIEAMKPLISFPLKNKPALKMAATTTLVSDNKNCRQMTIRSSADEITSGLSFIIYSGEAAIDWDEIISLTIDQNTVPDKAVLKELLLSLPGEGESRTMKFVFHGVLIFILGSASTTCQSVTCNDIPIEDYDFENISASLKVTGTAVKKNRTLTVTAVEELNRGHG